MPFDFYGLRNIRNQLRPLNLCDNGILGAWTYPQRAFAAVGVRSQKKDRIQPFSAGIALIRHFLGSKLGHLSNDPPIQVIAGSIRRNLREHLGFAAEPGVSSFMDALGDEEINY